jgi:2-polyprenyl-3-methyl-5-hydroxy-6-metoxy-1,4-benzoquinol methylase
MAKIRLREEGGEPLLGMNMHVLGGHQRLNYVMKHATQVKKDNLWCASRALDIGCGEGAFSLYLAHADWKVVAIDVLKPDLKHPNIKFIQMDVYDMSDDYDNTHDLVLMMEIIEHLEDPDEAVKIAFNAVRPNGKLLITTPWVNTWDYEEDHIWRFDEEGVVSLLPDGWECATIEKDNIFIYMTVQK